MTPKEFIERQGEGYISDNYTPGEVCYLMQEYAKSQMERAYFEGQNDSGEFDKVKGFETWYKETYEKKELEETIDIAYSWIKKKCGWSKFCDVTGGNHYAIKEFGEPYQTSFEVTISQAEELGYL